MTSEAKKLTPFERYQAYVVALEQAGKKFPINQFGDINFTQVGAQECGNRRQWFSESSHKTRPVQQLTTGDQLVRLFWSVASTERT